MQAKPSSVNGMFSIEFEMRIFASVDVKWYCFVSQLKWNLEIGN